jgi:hypothetical protein
MESNLLTSQYASIPRGRGTEGIDVESNETAWIDRLGRRESYELSANKTGRAETPEWCARFRRRAQPPTGQQLGFRES